MRIACLAAPLALLLACDPGPQPTMPPQTEQQQAQQEPAQEPAPPDVRQASITAGTIGLISVKNGDVEVPARFETVTGDVSLDLGDLNRSSGTVTVDLSSWNSDLPLRDERMKTTFFQVEDKPTQVSFTLTGIAEPSGPLSDIGSKATGKARGKLDWRGLPLELEVPVQVERQAADSFAVTTPTPFSISIEALGMNQPLAKLIKVCEHESVADAVQVSLDLQLGPAPSAAGTAEATTAEAGTAPPAEQ